MFNIKPNRRGLIQLLIISLGITTVINGILLSFNINQSVTQPIKPEYPLLPPSWMIGLIWMILIGFMTYTQWLLIKNTRNPTLLLLIPILFFSRHHFRIQEKTNLYARGHSRDETLGY